MTDQAQVASLFEPDSGFPANHTGVSVAELVERRLESLKERDACSFLWTLGSARNKGSAMDRESRRSPGSIVATANLSQAAARPRRKGRCLAWPRTREGRASSRRMSETD